MPRVGGRARSRQAVVLLAKAQPHIWTMTVSYLWVASVFALAAGRNTRRSVYTRVGILCGDGGI